MAIYYIWSGAGGTANGSSWANAFLTLAGANSAEAAGDTLYVAHDHNETTAAGISLNYSGTITNPTKIVCVDRGGTVPPVPADRRATAVVGQTTASTITLSAGCHYDGIIFSQNGGGFISITNATNQRLRFDNCSMRLTVAGSALINIATAASGCLVEFNNTTVSFAATTQSINVGGVFKWRNTASALLGAAVPATLFTAGASRGLDIECIGVDLSAAGSGKTIFENMSGQTSSHCRLIDCKLDAAVTISSVPVGHGSVEIDCIRSSATGNIAVLSHRVGGLLTQETTIVRTGGASDGTTLISWKVVTTANNNYSLPFECPPIAIWNDTTGSAKTATVEGIAAALPTDAECWLDVEYLGDASSPQGSFVNDGKGDLIVAAANQTTSTETWGGALTGKFKLAVTFTPQQKGWIYARVKIAKASSTFYIDPLVTLS